MNHPIRLTHNLEGDKFMWLWAKYVRGFNDARHCTNSLSGLYSKKLWKNNPDLLRGHEQFDEQSEGWRGIYICGVAKAGYSSKKNYPHNLHAAVIPAPGRCDEYRFENWVLSVENGLFTRIPAESELPERYKSLPPAFTTCRIFRWAVGVAPSLFSDSSATLPLLNH